MRKTPSVPVIVAFLILLTGPACLAQPDLSKAEIGTEKVAEGIWVLTGPGGNIGVSAGDDGVFLIDDQFAPLTDKIQAAVAKISDKPIRFVLNTHWHGDHTGGNEALGGAGAVIVAHDNVRERMSVDTFSEFFDATFPASPAVALPVVTFTDSVTFHLNGEEIHAFHVPPSHTDGDAIVHFRNRDVVHMGDLYFNGLYPFIDVWSGGSIDGYIAVVERALGKVGDGTRIIPGHGPVSGKAELATFLAMLEKTRAAVGALVEAGKSLEETVAAKPTAEFDEEWGKAFLTPEQYVTVLYTGLSSAE